MVLSSLKLSLPLDKCFNQNFSIRFKDSFCPHVLLGQIYSPIVANFEALLFHRENTQRLASLDLLLCLHYNFLWVLPLSSLGRYTIAVTQRRFHR
jgi:hypothetical protein